MSNFEQRKEIETTIIKMNAVFYLALVFGLGTCGVVKTEPKINEDEIVATATILKEITEHQVNGEVENSVLDIESQDEKLSTDVFNNDDVKNSEVMRCHWRAVLGNCTLSAPHVALFSVYMRVAKQGLDVSVMYHHREVDSIHMDKSTRFMFFVVLDSSYLLRVTESRRNKSQVTVCFRLRVRHAFSKTFYNFGCTSNIYKVTESQTVVEVTNWNFILSNSLEFDVDTDKTENVENFIESNQNENSLTWHKDV
ncbi:uncharacterized protein LOC115218383 isoform X2 [Octopus sinensis]|uniref:Uncharacterized protein LOC115218383 isoform X2 n=1 Tax=Octopus sinensis TaxID=2607531 RepID=A0A6P7T0Y1_9MOLL|nr:uncharacterized protein LOC115218383 isoform X2 [Octopus sinensis]